MSARLQTDLRHPAPDVGLIVSDLRKSFPSRHERIEVLRGISFSVVPGEAIAIVGESGAGKSTLLHLLGGIEPADHGSIQLGEIDILRLSPPQLTKYRNQQIGFVFQFHHLLPDLSASENVALPLLIRRTPRRIAMTRALAALDQIGLTGQSSQPVTELSGGEQQRVAVCRALITEPPLLLADEPTGNLDSKTGEMIATQLLAYAVSANAMVIIATHNQDLAQRCKRVLMLHEGRLVEAQLR